MNRLLRLPIFMSLCLPLVSLSLAAGCGGGGESTDSSESAASAAAAPTTSAGSFVVIESTDKIVGALGAGDDTLEAEASRPYGIGAIGAYILEKASGESFGVVTAYNRETGAARVEVVTNLATKEAVLVLAEDLHTSLDAPAREALLAALARDLAGVQRVAEANAAEAADVRPAGWYWSRDEGEAADGTWCAKRVIASLVTGVAGSAAAAAGAGTATFGTAASIYVPASSGVGFAIFGGVLGLAVGAVAVGVGVVTLAYTAYVCATE